MQTVIAEKAHATLSASSAHRWMTCPASVVLSDGIPDVTSPYAAEGTLAHSYAELTLKHLLGTASPAEVLTLKTFHASGDEEMVRSVKDYVTVIEALGLSSAQHVEIEARLPLTELTGEPEAYGTADCVLVNAKGELWVCDLKYGKGVAVSAENNPQLTLYALAAYAQLKGRFTINSIHLCISQPRLFTVSQWEVPIDFVGMVVSHFQERGRYALSLLEKGEAAIKPEDFNPCEHACQFCKAKIKCPAIIAKLNEQIMSDFEDLDSGSTVPATRELPATLTVPTDDTSLSKAFLFLPVLKTWMNAVEETAFHRAMAGGNLPGLKLVEGRAGARKWEDEARAELALLRMHFKADERFQRKVISPTAVEKLYKSGRISERQWKNLQKNITRAAPTPQLVVASDKRPAITSQPMDFEVLNE